MATKEQIEIVMKDFQDAHPVDFYYKINETRAGIGAVLRFLYESEGTVTAGKISAYMGVSTARVAILLKKMTAKGLIIKETDKADARVTVVRLSEYGEEAVEKVIRDIYHQVNVVIDKVGMERMLEYAQISREIKEAIKAPDIDF